MVDKNNNVITVYGVRYKLAPADWKHLRTFLSRATVLQDDKAPQDKSVQAPKLNDAVVERLIGHTNVVYYNFETKAWNTDTYNGYPIDGQEDNAEFAQAFKSAKEKEPNFGEQYEMVASVTMTIDSKFFSGWAKPVFNPKYSDKGTAVVGNIIVWNKKTKKYELYGKSWVGVYYYGYPYIAVACGAFMFANLGTRNQYFRRAIRKAHAQ